jgi:hypothetical protein
MRQSELHIDELQRTFTEEVATREREIKQLEMKFRECEDEDSMNAIVKQTKEIRQEIEEDQEDYLEEREELISILKMNSKTLQQLVSLVDEKVNECIFAIRREYTSFDNSWLPTEEFVLEAHSHFVKFVGFNTVIAQDIKGTIYYLNATTL